MKAEIYKLLAQYFVSVAADYTKGEEFMLDALKNKNDINGNLLLAQIYRMQGNYIFARKYVKIATELDVRRTWYKEISIENRNIVHAELLNSQNLK